MLRLHVGMSKFWSCSGRTEGVRPNEKEEGSERTGDVEFGLDGHLVCFIWKVRGGEFESFRILFDTLGALVEE
jgi:hypothetical protein